jgi:hypothetical protein
MLEEIAAHLQTPMHAVRSRVALDALFRAKPASAHRLALRWPGYWLASALCPSCSGSVAGL